jgi:hypothetical protein
MSRELTDFRALREILHGIARGVPVNSSQISRADI